MPTTRPRRRGAVGETQLCLHRRGRQRRQRLERRRAAWATSWRFATSTTTTWTKPRERFPDAKKFYDFRELFDEMSGQIDAVTVSTPDHMHAVAAARAMREGKAVYCQKPLTHSIWEARRMAEIAREMKVATQMGNQGTAGSGLRESAAIVQAGALGPVSEVHVWTNRPIWPQGGPRPASEAGAQEPALEPVAGPRARARLTADGYHPFAWRGWWDFGTGALGDMACHTMNMPFMALDLRDPISVDGRDLRPQQRELSEVVDHHLRVRRHRQAAGREDDLVRRRQAASLGTAGRGGDQRIAVRLIVGEKGKLYSPGDYGGTMKLLGGVEAPEVKFRESPGHFEEFVAGDQGGRSGRLELPRLRRPADRNGPAGQSGRVGRRLGKRSEDRVGRQEPRGQERA